MTKARHGVRVFWCISAAAWFALFGYGFARPAINTQFNVFIGVENLPLAMTLMVTVVFLAVWIFGLLLTRYGPASTLIITSIGSAVCLAIPIALIELGFKAAVWPLYFIKEAYIVLLIEQLWSCIASSFSKETAKKVGGPILGISTLGSILSGLMVMKFTKHLGTDHISWIAVGSCFFVALFGYYAYRYAKIRKKSEDASNVDLEPKIKVKKPDSFGFSLFWGRRGLQYILLIVLISQIYSAVINLFFQTMLNVDIPDADKQTAWAGGFFAGVNSCSLIFQFIITPLLLKVLPVWIFFFIVPLLNLSVGVWAFIRGDILGAASCYFVFKVLDYSLARITKEVCYIPYNFDVRYRAKQLIDVIAYRFGKSLTPTVIAGLSVMGVAITPYLYGVMTIGIALTWSVIGIPAGITQSRVTEGD